MLIKPRKRQIERDVEMRRPVRTMWDVDADITNALLCDMGVAFLQDESDEDENNEKPTPRHIPPPQLVPPLAPRVGAVTETLGDMSMQYHYPGGSQQISPQYSVAELVPGSSHNFLIKRNRLDYSQNQENHWNKLSDEIILSVFRWLPKTTLVKCARVCRRWNRLSFDETLWRRLDLANKTLKPGVVGRVLDRGVAVLRLAKSEIRSPLYKELMPSCSPIRISRVQYLDLSMSTCSTEALEQLLSSCHYLRKLSLENCQINDAICRYIGQNTCLEVLNLCMCSNLTENGLVPICNNLQRLEALNVGWTNMSRGAVVYLVICLPPTLTKLNLSGCRETLLDEDVQQLCRSCQNLKELDLSDGTSLSSQSVEFVATYLRGLEYIALSRCYHIAPASLPLLSNILTLLALDVFGMLKESALNQLRETMPSIEINKFPFSSIARPTTGIRRTSIWGLRVRDHII